MRIRRRGTILAAFALSLALPAAGQSRAMPSPPVPLRDAVKTEGLPLLIATNHLGLGGEATRVAAWVIAHPGSVTLQRDPAALQDGAGNRLPLSSTMAVALARINQWQGLAATKANPITHAQLRAAVLAPASIARVRDLFEAAIRRGVRIGGQWLTPETGGEATIDSELRFAEARDPRWSIVREMAALAGDPAALAAFFATRSREVAQVDTHGLLKNAVGRFELGTGGAREEISRALLTVARNAAPTYSMGPEEQIALVTSVDWQGRYVGGWHTHAPHDGNGAWVGGDVPSFEDMQNAVQYGQYLTLSFQPDGFDLYDAEALGEARRVDLALLKVIRYRSPSWRRHFEKLRPISKP